MAYRIGEKVIVIGKSYNHDFEIPSIVTIIRYDETDNSYDCEAEPDKNKPPHRMWVKANCIVSISKPNK